MPVDALCTEAPRKCNTKKQMSKHKLQNRKKQPRVEKSANHKTSCFYLQLCFSIFPLGCCCCLFLYLLLWHAQHRSHGLVNTSPFFKCVRCHSPKKSKMSPMFLLQRLFLKQHQEIESRGVFLCICYCRIAALAEQWMGQRVVVSSIHRKIKAAKACC